ncbi:MAG: fatty acid metabolism transcriptional regulator FadR [Chloroflexi bacterium HGW-Chloroflexi-10]|nr:MAG: fatty acid metabolism transcriptional regulator FadR [Chloroflexi bacterium HGW-Chloroflexi-10]
MNWEPTIKPTELAEQRLIQAILDDHFPINSTLPPERDLAGLIGVTRPTLRESMQRLAKDGWIEIRHGKPTRVRDFWKEGNITVLSSIAKYQSNNDHDFIVHLLQIRLLLSPTYAQMAIANQPSLIADFLKQAPTPDNSNSTYSIFDLQLHQTLAIHSGNPVFILILNGFRDLFAQKAQFYFSFSETRHHSSIFYRDLQKAATNNDSEAAKQITKKVMQDSIDFWSFFLPNK